MPNGGAGTLVLTGADTYTGNTLINAGMLVVNGSLLSPVTVAADGTLRGIGNLSGMLTVNGTLAPGDSVGTLTVSNNITMNAGSTFYTLVAGNNAFGKLNVTGTATLPDHANIVVDVLAPGYNTAGNRSAIGAASAIDSELALHPTSHFARMFGGFSHGQETQLSNAISQTLPLLTGASTIVAQSVLGRVNRIVQTRQETATAWHRLTRFSSTRKSGSSLSAHGLISTTATAFPAIAPAPAGLRSVPMQRLRLSVVLALALPTPTAA